MSLIDVIYSAIQEGTITAYGNAVYDDEFRSPMTATEIKSIGLKYVSPKAICIAPFLEAKASWYWPLGIYNKSPGFILIWLTSFPDLLILSSALYSKTG